MNALTIIGNLTNDPTARATAQGISVCDFTVAVNRRQKGDQEADYFRVTAWRQLGENCSRFLSKGRKVAVRGPVSARTYTAKDGSTRVSLEVTADDVEFLSPKSEAPNSAPSYTQAPTMQNSGFTAVETEELPF